LPPQPLAEAEQNGVKFAAAAGANTLAALPSSHSTSNTANSAMNIEIAFVSSVLPPVNLDGNLFAPRTLRREPVHLLLEYLFNLADYLLDFASEFFGLAFGFQVGVVRDLSGFLFNVAFQFMTLAFDLILSAWFHLVSPLLFSRTFH
jgi:hypothetical protein